MSFRCLSVFGRMFEYLPRISLKHSNMILVRIPSPIGKTSKHFTFYHNYLLSPKAEHASNIYKDKSI